jgi:hypothetical protein
VLSISQIDVALGISGKACTAAFDPDLEVLFLVVAIVISVSLNKLSWLLMFISYPKAASESIRIGKFGCFHATDSFPPPCSSQSPWICVMIE